VAGQLATIETIAVDPDRQRRGIGTALLAAAL
jgi:ribosomal protein S18 acetylase RimI-like enzyme